MPDPDDPGAPARIRDRDFLHLVSLAAADVDWDVDVIDATAQATGGPYRGYVRLGAEPGARYAYFAGRTAHVRDGVPVSEGLLFEVPGDLRGDPAGIPSNGTVFRELCEAMVAGDPRVLGDLRAAFGR